MFVKTFCSSSGDLTWSVSRGRSGWRGGPGRCSWPAPSACWAAPSYPLQLSPHDSTLHLGTGGILEVGVIRIFRFKYNQQFTILL